MGQGVMENIQDLPERALDLVLAPDGKSMALAVGVSRSLSSHRFTT